MLVVNGKMMLRIDRQIHYPGEEMDIPETTAKKLIDVGLATLEAPENAAIKKKKSRKKAGD